MKKETTGIHAFDGDYCVYWNQEAYDDGRSGCQAPEEVFESCRKWEGKKWHPCFRG